MQYIILFYLYFPLRLCFYFVSFISLVQLVVADQLSLLVLFLFSIFPLAFLTFSLAQHVTLPLFLYPIVFASKYCLLC